jgi:hypothetical protein
MTPPAAWPLGAAADAHLDRLVLRTAGLDEGAARTLARLVAEGLAPDLLRATGAAGLDSLQVQVAADADEEAPDVLAQRIVAEIGRVLARDRISDGPDGEAQ